MRVPHFKFYPNDFLGGVAYFTMEERGAYITLLCYQWDSGPIPKKRLGFLLGSGWDSIWAAISNKFQENEAGEVFNARLEEERVKSTQFIEKQVINGKKGGRPKTQKETQIKPKTYPKKKASDNDNGNDNDNDNKGGLGEKIDVREYLESPGGKHNLQYIHKNSGLSRSDFLHFVGQFILSREEDSEKEYTNQKQIIAGLQKYINTVSKNYHERANKNQSRGKGAAPISEQDEARLRELLASGALLGVD